MHTYIAVKSNLELLSSIKKQVFGECHFNEMHYCNGLQFYKRGMEMSGNGELQCISVKKPESEVTLYSFGAICYLKRALRLI